MWFDDALCFAVTLSSVVLTDVPPVRWPPFLLVLCSLLPRPSPPPLSPLGSVRPPSLESTPHSTHLTHAKNRGEVRHPQGVGVVGCQAPGLDPLWRRGDEVLEDQEP